ncbi:hypothetical protein M432DRAFT_638476 [Thermoascus aurantiacus ATCC 26904]
MISRPTGENARKRENTGNGIRTTVSAENLSVAMEGVSISEEEPAGTESSYSSEIFTILVGPGKHRFFAHRDILEESPFFEACCKPGFKEGRDKLIVLVDDDPSDFCSLLEFLYARFNPFDYVPGALHPADMASNLFYDESWRDPSRLSGFQFMPNNARNSSAVYRIFDIKNKTQPNVDSAAGQNATAMAANTTTTTALPSANTPQQQDDDDNDETTTPATQGKLQLDVLLRRYKMADKYMLPDWKEHLLLHILFAAANSKPREVFDFMAQVFALPFAPPDSYMSSFKRYVRNYFKLAGPHDTLMPELIAQGGPLAEIIFLTVRELHREEIQPGLMELAVSGVAGVGGWM